MLILRGYMGKLLINGKKKLFGEIEISASKNAYLPILAGCVLGNKKITLECYPNYLDTENMCKILQNLGAKVKKHDDVLEVDPQLINKTEIPNELASLVRSSIFMLGAIVGKFRKAKVAYPGGCEIGARPIDIHINGLKKLGVKIIEKHGYIYCDGSKMKPATIILDFPSVGATESLMMASVLLDGETVLYNVAKEPEIEDLQNFLNSMGAKIYGAGTDKIVVQGVKKLGGTTYSPIKDRIVAGTYLIATMMCGGKVTVKGVKSEHLHTVISKLEKSACKFKCKSDTITVTASKRPKSVGKIETAVYPGIPTDLQAQIATLQSISEGSSLLIENVFESRFKYVPELIKMGADINQKDRVLLINGVKTLYGADVTGTDLRGAVSLVLAGLSAEGYTTVDNSQYIDRGYADVVKELSSLGAEIKRL